MNVNQLYNLAFAGCVLFTVLGVLMGLAGVWFDEFYRYDWAWRMFATDLMMVSGCFVLAIIPKLWRW